MHWLASVRRYASKVQATLLHQPDRTVDRNSVQCSSLVRTRGWIRGVKKDVKHCDSNSAPLVFSASRSVRAVKPLASENTTAPEPLCRTRVSGCTSPCRYASCKIQGTKAKDPESASLLRFLIDQERTTMTSSAKHKLRKGDQGTSCHSSCTSTLCRFKDSKFHVHYVWFLGILQNSSKINVSFNVLPWNAQLFNFIVSNVERIFWSQQIDLLVSSGVLCPSLSKSFCLINHKYL